MLTGNEDINVISLAASASGTHQVVATFNLTIKFKLLITQLLAL